MADGAKNAELAKARQKMPFSVWVAIFIILVTTVIFLPTTIVFCGCMLPTLVAAVVDPRRQKTAWATVGALNFAGVVPAWFALWTAGGHSIDNALSVLAEPRTLFIAYMAAALGWIIYFQVPQLVSAVMARKAEKRLKDIDKRQKELVRKWGPEVAGEPAGQKN